MRSTVVIGTVLMFCRPSAPTRHQISDTALLNLQMANANLRQRRKSRVNISGLRVDNFVSQSHSPSVCIKRRSINHVCIFCPLRASWLFPRMIFFCGHACYRGYGASNTTSCMDTDSQSPNNISIRHKVSIIKMCPGSGCSESAFEEVLKRLPDAGKRCASQPLSCFIRKSPPMYFDSVRIVMIETLFQM